MRCGVLGPAWAIFAAVYPPSKIEFRIQFQLRVDDHLGQIERIVESCKTFLAGAVIAWTFQEGDRSNAPVRSYWSSGMHLPVVTGDGGNSPALDYRRDLNQWNAGFFYQF